MEPLYRFPGDSLSIWYKDDFFLSEKSPVRLQGISMSKQITPQFEIEQRIILKVAEMVTQQPPILKGVVLGIL